MYLRLLAYQQLSFAGWWRMHRRLTQVGEHSTEVCDHSTQVMREEHLTQVEELGLFEGRNRICVCVPVAGWHALDLGISKNVYE